MTTKITSEASFERATDEQIGHLKGLLDPRLRMLFKSEAQAFIHAGDKFQEMFDTGVNRLLERLLLEVAIANGKFDKKNVGLPLEQLPLTEEPVESVEEMHLNKYLSTRLVLAHVHGAGKKFASPLTALRYAAKYPDKQLDYPLVVIFEIDGQLGCLILLKSGSKRVFETWATSLHATWQDSDHFLVVDSDK